MAPMPHRPLERTVSCHQIAAGWLIDKASRSVSVSTTLVPPTYYEVRAKGEASRLYRTIADTAWALVQLAPIAAG
jgi:hypothetical protein